MADEEKDEATTPEDAGEAAGEAPKAQGKPTPPDPVKRPIKDQIARLKAQREEHLTQENRSALKRTRRRINRMKRRLRKISRAASK